MTASLDFIEKKAKTIEYTLGGDQRSIEITCDLAIEVQGLKKSNVVHEYISLGLAQKKLHLRADHVRSRIDDYTRNDFFSHDYLQSFRHGPASDQIPDSDMVMSCWLPTDVWSQEGELLTMHDIAAFKTRPPKFIRMVGETVANLGNLLEIEQQWNTPKAVNDASLSYARVWEKILLDAAVLSGKENQAAVSRFDVKARFFTVPPNTLFEKTNRPIKLFIAVSDVETTWLTPQKLMNACQMVVNAIDKILPNQQLPVIGWSQYIQNEQQLTQPPHLSNQQCRFVVALESEVIAYNTTQERLVRLSTNPLNFFSTYMLKGEDDLGKLVDMQVGAPNSSWQRPLPSKPAVVEFNNKLITKLGGKFRKKMSQVSVTTTTKSSLTPDATIDTTARQQTQNIMGDSANKWAHKNNWPASNSKEVIAEWLHREAHRFGGEEADLFPNLIFGSRECNTHMIRAENLINDVLRHKDRVANVDLETEVTDVISINMLNRDGTRPDVTVPWWNEFKTLGEYFYWMAPELAYKITVTLQNNHKIPGKSTFQPFHRYVPLRYELELDKFVLSTYFS